VLEEILGSWTKVKVLRLLLREPVREFSIQDVAQALGLSLGSVHPAVQQLLGARFVLTRRVGRSRSYRANAGHPLFHPLRSLFEAEVERLAAVAGEFADALPPRGVEAVVLFGSAARGRPAARSDVDVLVVARDPSAGSAVRRVAASMLERHDVNVSPLVLGKDEVAARLRAFDPLLLTIAQEGRLLRGRARWLAR
jgi:predicted nucleotidyltransferase